MEAIALIKIITLLALVAGTFLLLAWVFRPNSKKLYDKSSLIPLKKEGAEHEKFKK